ncbi:MAG: hypothetical protein AB7O98_17760 [Hyphomonadaceae bacterium]
MRTGLMMALGLAVSACAPLPPTMPATEASELLERFAAGEAPADMCSAQGRALLRGAVRAYGAAMAEAGEIWPTAPREGSEVDTLTSVEVSVLIAVASGFVHVSDLRGPARLPEAQMSFANWPAVSDLRVAARVACPELVRLQRTAARFVMLRDQVQHEIERAERRGGERVEARVRRQSDRLATTEREMEALANVVTEKVAEARG